MNIRGLQRISTTLAWDDLILTEPLREQIAGLENRVRHGPTLMEESGTAGRLRPGSRALFYGPPGTGKTLAPGQLRQA